MTLFGHKKRELPDLITDEELAEDQGVAYDCVIDYLNGLSEDDYSKVIKVAEIYRKATQDAADALGVENEPTTFINPPENTELVPHDVNHKLPGSDLDFLVDEPKTKSKRNKKIEVDQ